MPLDRQLFARDIAAALVEFAKQKYPTAPALGRAWRIDKTTAANFFKGHLSIVVLAKAIAAEGGDLWDALGAEITGETYEQRQERKLKAIIKEAADARQNLVQLRQRRAALDAVAPDVPEALDGPGAEQQRDRAGGGRGTADRRRNRSA